MKVKVKDVKANPYRNIDHYSLNKDKIMALTSSIEKTGFWDNLVGRVINPIYIGWSDEGDVVGTFDANYLAIESTGGGIPVEFTLESGEIQIAYGHHRIEALRLATGYGYDFEFDLPIRDISDGAMIQIMANENMLEWGHSIIVIDETVKVTKKFLENDSAFLVGKNAHNKNSRGNQYTKFIEASGEDIADFLGWGKAKIFDSLKRIKAIEKGDVDKQAIELLPSPSHAKEFTRAVSKTDFTPQEQRKIANEISNKGMGKRDVKGIIEVANFKKKYPRGEKKKVDSRVLYFAHKLGFIADDISSLSQNIKKLKLMHNEIKNIQGKKGVWNVQQFFLCIGVLQRHINEFLEVMSKDNELTEENINTLKQLKQ